MTSPQAEISSGRMTGATVLVDGAAVHAFKGVPYATAVRFGPPEPVVPWSGTRPAVEFSPAPPQPMGGPLDGLVPGSYAGTVDEHACLTLNVWTPDPGASEPKPVLVWFPGGAFTIGAASQPAYDGARFAAEQDVVIVTCNYRLGALGFLDARPFGGLANCGLRDAIAALEWVQQNISAFGGDPRRVTAFGESAGGGIVLHMCASPAARRLFSGAIVQSGATFNTLDTTRAATVLEALLGALGITDAALLATTPVDALIAAQGAAAGALLATVGMMPFHPMVDGDVLPAAPVDALRSGAAAGLPMVIGTTADEMRLFLDLAAPPPARDRLGSRVARAAGVTAGQAESIVSTYERSLATTDANEIWASVFSDLQMQVPADAMRVAHAPHGPTYAYLFRRSAVDPLLGACHGIDIPFTFGNFVDGWAEFVGADDAARATGRAIRTAWANVARGGDPGWPRTPATKIFGPETVEDDPLRSRLTSLAD